MRRWASAPTGSSDGTSGALPGHHTTTGASGTSSGSTTDSVWCARGPRSRSSTTSPRPSLPPTVMDASSCGLPRPGRGIAARIRQGCSRAARTAQLDGVGLGGLVGDDHEGEHPPDRAGALREPLRADARRDRARRGVLQHDRHGRLQTRPSRASISSAPAGPQVPDAYCSGLPCSAQWSSDRVEHPPGQLDLLGPGEQRRVAQQHVEQQPLVRLRAGLGERVAVREVHAHVPDLHLGAGHLGAEAHRDALVGLDADDQGVLAELLGVGDRERQVRGPLEDHGDLGDPAAEALAGTQVERHARPAPGVDLELDRGVGVGRGGGRDAVLLQVAQDRHAALPAGGVLAPGGVLGQVRGQLDRGEDLLLLHPDVVRGERERLLHRGQGEQLQQVVLDDVARGADAVVVARPGRRCRCPRPS